MTPARILYVNPTAQLGGAEYSLLDLASSLDGSRFVPTLACFGEGPLASEAALRGIRVVALRMPRQFAQLSLKGERSGAAALAVAAASAAPMAWRLRQLAADAAIVHTNGNKAHVLASLRTRRARLIWHVRDFWRDGAIERSMARFANSRVSAVIANSSAVRAHLIGLGVVETLVQAVPNGIDIERFRPDGSEAPLREQFGWSPQTPLVGIVGMLARWKGQHVVLRAFAEVLRRRPDARCVISGGEIYVTRGQTGFGAEIQHLIRELHIEHAVGLTGYRTDVPAILRALNVVVHASIEPEPFGRVIAEGMATGKPVIATDAGGAPEVTGTGAAALLVPAGDISALASAILRLLDHPVEAQRLGIAGRHRIVESFSIAGHVERVQAVYERLLSSPAAYHHSARPLPGEAR